MLWDEIYKQFFNNIYAKPKLLNFKTNETQENSKVVEFSTTLK